MKPTLRSHPVATNLLGPKSASINSRKKQIFFINGDIAYKNCFRIGDGFHLKDVFPTNIREIYKASKTTHLKAIAKKTGESLKDMIFFDNEYGNCKTVASIGVTVMYTPDGVTRENFEEALAKFPASGQVLGPKNRGYW